MSNGEEDPKAPTGGGNKPIGDTTAPDSEVKPLAEVMESNPEAFCVLGGKVYALNARKCINGFCHICTSGKESGVWVPTEEPCDERDPNACL